MQWALHQARYRKIKGRVEGGSSPLPPGFSERMQNLPTVKKEEWHSPGKTQPRAKRTTPSLLCGSLVTPLRRVLSLLGVLQWGLIHAFAAFLRSQP